MEIYTIGFTKKSAREFFETLKRHGIRRLVDVRLNNVSQLAGFTKKNDLQYFLRNLCAAEYIHKPLLSPTKELLDSYKKKVIAWEQYEHKFNTLLTERRAETLVPREWLAEPTVLMCSEPEPDRCHRRLVAEYLKKAWPTVDIIHL